MTLPIATVAASDDVLTDLFRRAAESLRPISRTKNRLTPRQVALSDGLIVTAITHVDISDVFHRR
jgi:hypothetical protein